MQSRPVYHQTGKKTLNLPNGAKSWRIEEADGLGNIADRSIKCKDMKSDKIGRETAEIASRKVKKSNEVENVKLTSRAPN